jgi:hypothetical protein
MRSLRIEPLERRELLSVAVIGEESKALNFTAKGNVVGAVTVDVQGQPVQVSPGGKGTLAGTIVYHSHHEGEIAGGALSANGVWKKGSQSGTWGIDGHADLITDANALLCGSMPIDPSYVKPWGDDLLNGTYEIENGFFKTTDFSIGMNLTNADHGSLTFKNGKLTPTEKKAFNVVVTPTWNANGTILVNVRVPGKVHTTKTADRTVPATNIKLYWAKGTGFSNKLGSALSDKIPVYWNQASGRYQVANLPSAPAGATHLLFVAKFDRATRVAALALPKVSVGNPVPVDEGDRGPREPMNHASFPVTLVRKSTQPVTAWYSTLQGTGISGARPGVDYQATKGSIVIPAGQTQGEIKVPILGDTTYELDEWFTVKLDLAQNAAVDKAHAKGVIENDDSKPSVSINDVALAEGNPGDPPSKGVPYGYTRFVFTVTLSSRSYQTVKVWFETWSGKPPPATPGVDYERYKGKSYHGHPLSCTFAPGETTWYVYVYVRRDANLEPSEAFFVHLYGANNATIADAWGEGTILNDDAAEGQNAASSRDAALSRLAGLGQLAGCFEPLGRKRNNKDAAAADLILAVP